MYLSRCSLLSTSALASAALLANRSLALPSALDVSIVSGRNGTVVPKFERWMLTTAIRMYETNRALRLWSDHDWHVTTKALPRGSKNLGGNSK